MAAPSNQVFVNGGPSVTGDELNTFVQSVTNVSALRGFIGVTGMQIELMGTTIPGDGGQGVFYWNATGTNPDDNGATTVIPNGSSSGNGEWTRLGAAGVTVATLTVTGNATIGGTLAVAGVPMFNGVSVTKPLIDNVFVQLFTSSGTYTPTEGMQYATIELVGGGGSGGGVTGAGSNVASSGGGGGGAYSRKTVTAGQVGADATVTIGAGGAAPVAGNNNGNAGGTTTVLLVGTGTLSITAPGGSGGGNMAYGTGYQSAPGGAGGVAGANTDITIPGMAGFNGYAFVTYVTGANGGSAQGGLGGAGGQVNATIQNGGNAGQLYGGGGSGATSNASNAAGGAGAKGVVMITEYVAD